MPNENKKRGRREEKKRKREDGELEDEISKRQKSKEVEGEIDFVPFANGDGALEAEDRECIQDDRPGEMPFYGLLDDDEQEYFKSADSMLELNQFPSPEEREIFLANVYKEASGKELKLANSQSCSRLLERLIMLSTPEQLKVLFQKLSGHFLHLVQHRFASHCCEALFLKAAPAVTKELLSPPEDKQKVNDGAVFVSMENLLLYTANELEGNLGYLMTDQFASHPLRILLAILSGMPLSRIETNSLMQSKKKEHVSITGNTTTSLLENSDARFVPDSFETMLDKMLVETVAGLTTTDLRALATHPIANPVLQLLLQLELTRSGKQSAKDPDSLFHKLLPDDPPEEGTESASFINSLTYDIIGSRLLEVIVTNAPGKTFKALFRSSFSEKLGTLAKNETAAFVVIKIIERLNKNDLQTALDRICPQVGTLIQRSRTSVIKTLIERCRVRDLKIEPISESLQHAYSGDPSETLKAMLKISSSNTDGISEDRKRQLEARDSTKAHTSLLAQSMLEAPGPLREFITDGLLALEGPLLIDLAKDRTASRVLQAALVCPDQTPRFRKLLIPRLHSHIEDLATHPVASHVIDALWQASEGLTFIRERIADKLARHESPLRDSISGRAVWRNWKMDIYKSRRNEWLNDGKGQFQKQKSAIDLARERAMAKKGNRRILQDVSKSRMRVTTGANAISTRAELS